MSPPSRIRQLGYSGGVATHNAGKLRNKYWIMHVEPYDGKDSGSYLSILLFLPDPLDIQQHGVHVRGLD